MAARSRSIVPTILILLGLLCLIGGCALPAYLVWAGAAEGRDAGVVPEGEPLELVRLPVADGGEVTTEMLEVAPGAWCDVVFEGVVHSEETSRWTSDVPFEHFEYELVFSVDYELTVQGAQGGMLIEADDDLYEAAFPCADEECEAATSLGGNRHGTVMIGRFQSPAEGAFQVRFELDGEDESQATVEQGELIVRTNVKGDPSTTTLLGIFAVLPGLIAIALGVVLIGVGGVLWLLGRRRTPASG